MREKLCPRERASEVGQMMAAYRMLRLHGILPVAGGWLDQTQGFIDAVGLLDEEVFANG